MKRIYIMRHGKAEWHNGEMEDFDRPLKERGHKAAGFMGSLLAVHQEIPELIISSSALRAQQTAEDFVKALGQRVPIVNDDSLYMPTVRHLMQVISEVDASVDAVMLIGHNPASEQLVEHLTAGSGLNFYFPTCGVVCLDADIEVWADIEPEEAVMKWFLIPKLFMKKHI